MNHTKRILVASFALLLTSSVFAASGTTSTGTDLAPTAKTSLVPPSNLTMVAKTDTSVTLQWDKVVGAASYIVKYGKKSVATSKDPLAQYEDETDPLTETGKVIDKLSPDTEYYFSVVSLDDKMNESDLFSNELAVKTDASGATTASGTTASGVALTAAPSTPALAIDKTLTKPVDNKTIDLFFNNELSTDAVTVKITKTNDNSDVSVLSTIPDVANKNEVVVKLNGVLDPSAAYSLVVLTAKDTAGNNIQNGPDGIAEFTTDANLAVSVDASGATASGATASGATASGAVAATELPKTGPQENIIVIASLLIAGALVYLYRARKA